MMCPGENHVVPLQHWIPPLVALTLAQVAAIARSVYAHRALRLHPADREYWS